ncbi:MAG: DUF1670 domain-containing protein [Deltaproteobacteria bacterium]|nr:DUF1670 domain-containing protein [Deltaproteobacteria bacterium]
MKTEPSLSRLQEKDVLHTIQVELQQGYDLSPVEAQVLAQRVQQLVDEQAGSSRRLGQISYQAIDAAERAGRPLRLCRKVPIHLTLADEGDAEVWALEGPEALRRLRVHRMVYEAHLQGGALSQEDLASLMGISTKTVKRIFAHFREQGERLPSRGELQDIGRGVSHKVPVIRKYIQDLSFSHISRHLGQHGIHSMARYLNHFSMVMVLEDRELTPGQMQSVIGISENLIEEYRVLYAELNVAEHQRALERLKRTITEPHSGQEKTGADSEADAVPSGQKGGAA